MAKEKKPMYAYGDTVRSKVDMGEKLEVLKVIATENSFYYKVVDTKGVIKEVHQSMLLKYK